MQEQFEINARAMPERAMPKQCKSSPKATTKRSKKIAKAMHVDVGAVVDVSADVNVDGNVGSDVDVCCNVDVVKDIDVDATTTNTANKVVARDGSGNFAAGTITATSFSGPLSSTDFDIDSDIIPKTADQAEIGSTTRKINNIYANQADITTVNFNYANISSTSSNVNDGGLNVKNTNINLFSNAATSGGAQIGFFDASEVSNN